MNFVKWKPSWKHYFFPFRTFRMKVCLLVRRKTIMSKSVNGENYRNSSLNRNHTGM